MTHAPAIRDLETRRLGLRRSKRRATGLLVLAVLVLIGTRLVQEPSFAIRLITAAAEAAIVGGLADWFAVTALFRRPLRLPIPHTGLIPARKDEIGRSLAAFVRDQFLDPDLLIERLRRGNRAAQLAQWLGTASAADFIADRLVAIIPILLSRTDDAQLRQFLRAAAHGGLSRLDLVPTTDAVLETMVREGKHMAIADALVELVQPSLASLQEPIIARVGERTGRFFPAYFDRKIAEGVVAGVQKWLDAVRTPGSDERRRLEAWMAAEIARFRASPDYADLIRKAQETVVNHPALGHSLGTIWDEIKRELTEDAQSPSPRLRAASAEIVRSLGRLLAETPAVQQYLNAAIERVLVDYIAPWRAEIGNYIADVVAGWDGRQVADLIELQVGRDLQYIRINGTLVGALIGSGLFLLGAALPGVLGAIAAFAP
jgi:uncharacterized membrane-anchored protein YjiN (DUF445 family)